MITRIRLKRKTTTGNSKVVLQTGEPYYNTKDKRLYIGDSENQSLTNKKHIAQVTTQTADDDTISFWVGEDTTNTYNKTIKVSSLTWKEY